MDILQTPTTPIKQKNWFQRNTKIIAIITLCLVLLIGLGVGLPAILKVGIFSPDSDSDSGLPPVSVSSQEPPTSAPVSSTFSPVTNPPVPPPISTNAPVSSPVSTDAPPPIVFPATHFPLSFEPYRVKQIPSLEISERMIVNNVNWVPKQIENPDDSAFVISFMFRLSSLPESDGAIFSNEEIYSGANHPDFPSDLLDNGFALIVTETGQIGASMTLDTPRDSFYIPEMLVDLDAEPIEVGKVYPILLVFNFKLNKIGLKIGDRPTQVTQILKPRFMQPSKWVNTLNIGSRQKRRTFDVTPGPDLSSEDSYILENFSIYHLNMFWVTSDMLEDIDLTFPTVDCNNLSCPSKFSFNRRPAKIVPPSSSDIIENVVVKSVDECLMKSIFGPFSSEEEPGAKYFQYDPNTKKCILFNKCDHMVCDDEVESGWCQIS